MWVHCRGLDSLKRPVPLLPAGRRPQSVNDGAVQHLNLLFFFQFHLEWRQTFEKLHFLTFGRKHCFYLTYSAREYFEKLTFKKNATLNCCISKPRADSEWKLTFYESSFFLKKNRSFFCPLYRHGYTARRSAPYNHRPLFCQQVAGLKEIMMRL